MPKASRPSLAVAVPKSAFGAPLRWYHQLVWSGLRLLVRLLYPLHVEGAHLIPRSGPALIIAPHMCYSDSMPFLYASLPRPPRFIGSAFFILANAPVSWLMFLGGAVPLYKHRPDTEAIRKILRLLAGGDVVALFPEGERSWAGVPQDLLTGSARLISRLKVPIYLAQIEGSYDHWPRWDDVPRWRPVTVRFSGPLSLPRIPAQSGHEPGSRPCWWHAVYRRGSRIEAASAGDALSKLFRDATRGEDARLDLSHRGRFGRVPRLICFCPECGGIRSTAHDNRFACPDCGAAWSPAPNGALLRVGTSVPVQPRLLSDVFVDMLATLRTRVTTCLPLKETVFVSVMGNDDAAPARGHAVLDRSGLAVTTDTRAWHVTLEDAADGPVEGCMVIEVHATDGTALSLRTETGALRLVLAACALCEPQRSRFVGTTPPDMQIAEQNHA